MKKLIMCLSLLVMISLSAFCRGGGCSASHPSCSSHSSSSSHSSFSSSSSSHSIASASYGSHSVASKSYFVTSQSKVSPSVVRYAPSVKITSPVQSVSSGRTYSPVRYYNNSYHVVHHYTCYNNGGLWMYYFLWYNNSSHRTDTLKANTKQDLDNKVKILNSSGTW